jgi:hypothetical protein
MSMVRIWQSVDDLHLHLNPRLLGFSPGQRRCQVPSSGDGDVLIICVIWICIDNNRLHTVAPRYFSGPHNAVQT